MFVLLLFEFLMHLLKTASHAGAEVFQVCFDPLEINRAAAAFHRVHDDAEIGSTLTTEALAFACRA